MKRIMTIKGGIVLAVLTMIMAGAAIYAFHTGLVFKVDLKGDAVLQISTADPMEVYLVSGDGTLVLLKSGDTLDFGLAEVDFWGTGPTPKKQVKVKNTSNTYEQVMVTGDQGGGILPLFGTKATNLQPAPKNAFILASSGDTGDMIMGYLGIKFLPGPGQTQLATGTKQTTIIFRATDVPPEPARIAFTTYKDGNWEIYTVKPDGTGLVRLTSTSSSDLRPRWSSDAQKIAWECIPNYANICVMDADGSNQLQLTSGSYNDLRPTWSPNPHMIAFQSYKDNNWEIYRINVDGTSLTRLTNHSASDYDPDWSASGDKIAFVSTRNSGYNHIFTMTTGGTTQTAVTSGSFHNYQPRVSPDGTQVVFYSYKDGNAEIYKVNIDGTGLTRFTNNSNFDGIPRWSPDGSKIAWECYRSGRQHICSKNEDLTNERQLTSASSYHYWPNWAPDSNKLTFHRCSHCRVWVMDADGTKATRITNFYEDHLPEWAPVGFVPATIGSSLGSVSEGSGAQDADSGGVPPGDPDRPPPLGEGHGDAGDSTGPAPPGDPLRPGPGDKPEGSDGGGSPPGDPNRPPYVE